MIEIQENILLEDFTTFKIGGKAKYFCVVKNEDDLREAFSFSKSRRLPFFVLGGGSNILFSDHGFPGLVIKNEIKGVKFSDKALNKVVLEVGAGEVLDEIIALSVIRDLSGIENLSGIPGTVGGAAVQNAGAYGVELKDCLLSVAGLNLINGERFVLKNDDRQYYYRDSKFKKNKKFVITFVTLELNNVFVPKLDYIGLRKSLAGKEIINAKEIREAILKIREGKLPDWRKVNTAGSFFKNPVVTKKKFNELKKSFLGIPSFSASKGKVRVPLAWILDNICRLKGYRNGNIGLYYKQPIIFINYGGATSEEVKSFSEKIKRIVKEKTGIKIEEEVEKV